MSHRPGSTCVIGKHTFTRKSVDEWWAPDNWRGFTDCFVNDMGFEVSPPSSVPNVVVEDLVFMHHKEKFAYLPVEAEWVNQEALAVLKSAVVKELKWASPVQKGDVPALCVEVYSRNFVRDKQYRILVIEPSPSPLDGERC